MRRQKRPRRSIRPAGGGGGRRVGDRGPLGGAVPHAAPPPVGRCFWGGWRPRVGGAVFEKVGTIPTGLLSASAASAAQACYSLASVLSNSYKQIHRSDTRRQAPTKTPPVGPTPPLGVSDFGNANWRYQGGVAQHRAQCAGAFGPTAPVRNSPPPPPQCAKFSLPAAAQYTRACGRCGPACHVPGGLPPVTQYARDPRPMCRGWMPDVQCARSANGSGPMRGSV